MGRPRQFSRDSVIDTAMPVFWTHGFARTSVHELEAATGVNKSGLYAEFKGKEDLFLACLRRYYETRLGRSILARAPLGWDNIQHFLEMAPGRAAGQHGCFGVNSMRELADLPPEANAIMTENRTLLKAIIQQNVAAACPGADAAALGEMIAAFFSGLCIECNLTAEPMARETAIARFMALLRAA